MNLIFLDWDGVLNDFKPGEEGAFKQNIKRECLDALEWLLQTTGASIVLTSSWRLIVEDVEEWENELHRLGVPSARVGSATRNIDIQHRGYEIYAWFEERPLLQECPFVILDDCDNMVPYMDRLVQTQTTVGLTMDDARRAARMLGWKGEQL